MPDYMFKLQLCPRFALSNSGAAMGKSIQMLEAFFFNPIAVARDVGFGLGIIPTNRLMF